MVDVELADATRGQDLADATRARMIARAPMAAPPERPPINRLAGEYTLTWGDFQARHPEWRGEYWAECRALYAGGDRLLGDPKVLDRLFPRHLYEDATVYAQRRMRAHYFPYAGTIIDHLLSGLGTDPLLISFVEVDEAGKAKAPPPGAEWWQQWVCDVTDEAERPADYGLEDDDDEDDDEGGCDMHHFIVEALREALQTRTAWVLADLPPADPDAPIDSRLAAEAAGLMDPYLQIVPTEQVIDWQTDRRGRLQWVMMMTCEQLRASPSKRRGVYLHTYTVWDAESWQRYEIEVDPQRLPNEATPYQPIEVGEHGFGRVPFERMCLPEGLYAMGKLHSLAREHFNKRAAMSWAEYKSLFKILYEFLGPEDAGGLPVAMAQQDADRATNQIRGQGFSQVRGKDDRAEFVGPDPETFTAARESCNDTMREMHRVMFSMAMSANMDSAALKRSAGSKQSDAATTEVLLDAFGQLMRKFARRLLVLASLGRSEAVPHADISGLEKFDVTGLDSKIAEAVQLFAGVPMLSPLVKELYLAQLYSDLVGDLTQEQREQIREEIREAQAAEELAAAALAGAGGMGGAGDPGSGDPAGDDTSDDAPPGPAAKPKAKPGRTSMSRGTW